MEKLDALPKYRQTTTNGGSGTDRVLQLCERIRKVAEESGQESLRAAQQQADALVEEARSRAEVEARSELQRVEEQLEKEISRELQNARLEARARLAGFRWSELDAVLEEAEQEIARLRQHLPQRYTDAMMRFYQVAYDRLPSHKLLIRANAADLSLLGEQLLREGRLVEFVEDNSVGHGIVVTTADANIVCEQSISRRRQRLDHDLRLAAAELLFSDDLTDFRTGNST